MVALLVIGGTWKKDTTNKKREREREMHGENWKSWIQKSIEYFKDYVINNVNAGKGQ